MGTGKNGRAARLRSAGKRRAMGTLKEQTGRKEPRGGKCCHFRKSAQVSDVTAEAAAQIGLMVVSRRVHLHLRKPCHKSAFEHSSFV